MAKKKVAKKAPSKKKTSKVAPAPKVEPVSEGKAKCFREPPKVGINWRVGQEYDFEVIADQSGPGDNKVYRVTLGNQSAVYSESNFQKYFKA